MTVAIYLSIYHACTLHNIKQFSPFSDILCWNFYEWHHTWYKGEFQQYISWFLSLLPITVTTTTAFSLYWSC